MSVNCGQFRGHWFTEHTPKGNFDFKEDSCSTTTPLCFWAAERQTRLSLWENMCFYHLVFSRNTSKHTHTHKQTMHTHTLPTWLLGETTSVGVLCFCNDSKDDLESAEKAVEWERGKCKKIVSNERRQLVCSQFTDTEWYFKAECVLLVVCLLVGLTAQAGEKRQSVL